MSDVPAVVERSIESTIQQITFNVGHETFGVDIMCVEEIIIPKACTAIPRTPDYFVGIINLRGEVISIIDLRTRFKMPHKEVGQDSRIVVIHAGGMKFGMLTDNISSIVTLERSEVQKASLMVTSDKQQYIKGSYRLDDDRILLLLDSTKLINEDDFVHQQDLIAAPAGAGDAVATLEVKEDTIPEVFLVGFAIGSERYAIESLSVEEIILMPEITPIPEMEAFVEGIFHLRESVIPVLRLANKLEVSGREITAANPVIIVKVFGVKVGLIVDEITEVYLIKENEIVDPPINLNAKQLDQLRGVIKLQRENKTDIVMLLRLAKLFSEAEQEILEEIDLQNESDDSSEGEREEEVPILEFILNDEKYAVEVMQTNEIIPVREIVPVPKSPAHIMGVINLRGEVLSIIDLPKLVERDNYKFTEDTKILIVDGGDEVAGLIVEKVVGIRKVYLSTFEPPSDLVRQRGNVFIRGMSKDDKTDDIVVLMDLVRTIHQARGEEFIEDDEMLDNLAGIKAELENLQEEDLRLLPPEF